MMQFSFDLISDLYIDQWKNFNWQHQATSPVCIVAGNIATNHRSAVDALRHLGQCYQAVFYIDGNAEHSAYLSDISTSYQKLNDRINDIPNVVYLQDNVVVIDGVAILGTNGWWAYDFDLSISIEESELAYSLKEKIPLEIVTHIRQLALADSTYITASIKRLQTHADVKHIVVVTNTVPDPALVEHDLALANTHQFNIMGNRYMMQSIAADTEHKLHTWCFGSYTGNVDQVKSGIHFVNNTRGTPDQDYPRKVYYPRRISVDV